MRERARREAQAQTAELERQERIRAELVRAAQTEEAKQALKRGVTGPPTGAKRATVAEDPHAKPLLWVHDDAIGRSA